MPALEGASLSSNAGTGTQDWQNLAVFGAALAGAGFTQPTEE
jgi:hypothetical protein